MATAEVIRASARTGTSPLASPAVVSLGHVPGARQLLFAGEIVDPSGVPVDGAVLTVWGIELNAETQGRFELLAYGPRSGPAPILVTIAAPGHAPVDVRIVVDHEAERLADGTLLLLHTFVLGSGDAR